MKLQFAGKHRHHDFSIRAWMTITKKFFGLGFLPGINFYIEEDPRQLRDGVGMVIRSHKLTFSWICFALAFFHSSVRMVDRRHMKSLEAEVTTPPKSRQARRALQRRLSKGR